MSLADRIGLIVVEKELAVELFVDPLNSRGGRRAIGVDQLACALLDRVLVDTGEQRRCALSKEEPQSQGIYIYCLYEAKITLGRVLNTHVKRS